MAWPTIERGHYLNMLDRHRPLWSALHEFVYANGIRSVIEAGCGVAALCTTVDSYTGIDINPQVLRDNEAFYGTGDWIDDDWLAMDVSGRQADLFVSTSLIEHCESYEPFLRQVMSLSLKYAVVTFHKGLRDAETIRLQRTNHRFFDNFYCREHVERWLTENAAGKWSIFMLPVSRTQRTRRKRWDSVLVIDWTGRAKLDMWEKRNVAS